MPHLHLRHEVVDEGRHSAEVNRHDEAQVFVGSEFDFRTVFFPKTFHGDSVVAEQLGKSEGKVAAVARSGKIDNHRLILAGECQSVVNAGGQFFIVVRNHDERAVRASHIGVNDASGAVGQFVVESVERFVEDEEGRLFDEGTHQQHQSLFTVGE